MKYPDLVVSQAHEVHSADYASGHYVCIACGLRGNLDKLFGPQRCKPHLVTPSSGWLEEAETNRC